MRARIRPFRPSDMLGFAVQPVQASEVADDPAEAAKALLAHVAAPIAVECADGRVRAVGGAFGDAPVLTLSALVAADAGPWMLGIVRALRAWLPTLGAHRIAMTVRADFEEGHRFARLLGFGCEGCMRAFGADGEDYMLFAWIASDHAREAAA